MKNLIILLVVIINVLFLTSCLGNNSSPGFYERTPLDVDGDGIPNIIDTDDDNDNVPDNVDVDDDGDGFIEIADATALNNIRYSLTGISYDDEKADSGTGDGGDITGCGGLNNRTMCRGYELVADITLPAATGTPAKNWEPMGKDSDRFRTIFEGNNFTIRNLVINSDETEVGFTGWMSGIIRNLHFRGGSITSSNASTNVGTVVGMLTGGILDGVSADLPINLVAGTIVAGGLVGTDYDEGGSIENSYATGDITVTNGAYAHLGGLMGYSNATSIISSYATGNITAQADFADLGGLIGCSYDGTSIENSYATGNITSSGKQGNLGGLVGEFVGDIKNSYATGTITGGSNENSVGGLVGTLAGSIKYSYSISRIVSGRGVDRVGALAGEQVTGATISNSYYNNEETIDIINPIPDDTLLSVGNSKTADELKGLDSSDSLSSNDWAFEASKYPTLRSYKLDANLDQVEGDILCGQAPDTDFVACVVTTPDRTIGDTDGDGTNDDIDTDDDGDGVLDGDDVDDDGDGLIEIATFAELNNIRYNLAGTSYDDEEADTGTGNDVGNSSGCGGLNMLTVCSGYELVADITLPTATGTPAKNWVPVGDLNRKFSATLEGNDYTINGLIINSNAESNAESNAQSVGFISALSGRIANLNFRGGSVVSDGGTYVGAVVGSNEGELDRVSTGLPVTSSNVSHVGGLVGWGSIALIKNSYATGEIITGGAVVSDVGGLVGRAWMSTIENSYATGNVTNSASDSDSDLGGLVGEMIGNSIIRNSYAKGNITGSDGKDYLGGLAGDFIGTIKNSYATGDVVGGNVGGNVGDILGGLVGVQRGSIESSYAIGTATGGNGYDRIGYLVGFQVYGRVFINNYYQSGQIFDLDNTGNHTNDILLEVGTGQADSELRALSATDLNAKNWTFEADKYPTLRNYKIRSNDATLTQIQGDIICGQLPAINYVQCLPADSN